MEDVHHLHVWQVQEGRLALESHIGMSETNLGRATNLKEQIKGRLREKFGIDHATLEMELSKKVRHSRDLLAKDEGH